MLFSRLFAVALAVSVGWLAWGTTPLPAAPKSADPAVQALITQLKSRDAHVRMGATRGRGPKRDDAKAVIPALADALSDREEVIRVDAALALANFGPAAKSAIPALIRAVRGKNVFAVYALKRMGPDARDAVPALIDTLRDKKAIPFTLNGEPMSARHLACMALGKIGKEARAAAPAW